MISYYLGMPSVRRHTGTIAACLALVALGAIAGCVSREKPSITADDPQAQNEWIAEAVDKGDWSAVPGLIELLDSSDPAERLVAIGALRSITGENHGYRIADPPAIRAQAADRWAAWWIEHEQGLDASPPSAGADTGT